MTRSSVTKCRSVSTLVRQCLFAVVCRVNPPSDAAAVLVGNQITTILRFFLSKNIRIARDRAWDQTVASRGKGTTFWQPYVEEWENPPKINVDKSERMVKKVFGSWFGLFMVKRGQCIGLVEHLQRD